MCFYLPVTYCAEGQGGPSLCLQLTIILYSLIDVCNLFSHFSLFSVCTYANTVWVILDFLCIIRVKLREDLSYLKKKIEGRDGI